MKPQLLSKIENRTARIAITSTRLSTSIGLGYVGLPLTVAFAEAGFPVVDIDVDASKVDAVNAGRSTISDIPNESLSALVTVETIPEWYWTVGQTMRFAS
jgi:UDP-N-acetyl-D-glucosamine dehydrogenase